MSDELKDELAETKHRLETMHVWHELDIVKLKLRAVTAAVCGLIGALVVSAILAWTML